MEMLAAEIREVEYEHQNAERSGDDPANGSLDDAALRTKAALGSMRLVLQHIGEVIGS